MKVNFFKMAAKEVVGSSIRWDSFLPSHSIFKALGKDPEVPKEQPYLGRNILAEHDGDLFLWDNERKRINVANLRNLKAKNEKSSKLQTLLCTSPPLFTVTKMVFSETGSFVALIGRNGVSIVELPQKRGKFTLFEHGKENITCRTTHIDGRFFTCHPNITIHQVKWFPGSLSDTYIVVLTSDNRLRIYDITEDRNPVLIITVGAVPSEQSLCSPTNATFAEAFGEVVVAFDFAPMIEVELDMLRLNESVVAYPVFLLQENGDVKYLLLVPTTQGFYYELRGYLSISPAAEDNYGVESCAILCFPTNPVVVAIATSSGTIYHCIVLDADCDDEDYVNDNMGENLDLTKDERHIRCLVPKVSLLVYECMELSLTPPNDLEDNLSPSKNSIDNKDESKDENRPVKLLKDPVSVTRYHCYHNFGVHTINLPWVKNLQQFCFDNEQSVSFNPSENGNIQHLVCTNPVSISDVSVVGFTVVSDWDLGPTLIVLTNQMDCITKPLKLLNRHASPAPSSTKQQSEKKTDSAKSGSYFAGQFENHIRQILKRERSNPVIRSAPRSSDISAKERFQFLSGLTQSFRSEYINKQKLANIEIQQRLGLLQEQADKQKEDLKCITNTKRQLQDRLECLAEKYEETKERQEMFLKRIHRVLDFVQSKQPILSDAEMRMKDELVDLSENVQKFKVSFDQLQHKRKYLQNRRDKGCAPLSGNLNNTQIKQLKFMMKEQGDVIQDLIQQVNDLKLHVGY